MTAIEDLQKFRRRSEMDAAFKAGEVVRLSSGSYSDYSVRAVVRVVKDFDIEACAKSFVPPKDPRGYNRHGADEDNFVKALVAGGFVTEIECDECALDDLKFGGEP